MTDLKCIGASEVKCSFIGATNEFIAISKYKIFSSGETSRIGSKRIDSLNGGTMSYRIEEDIPQRKYIKIGTFISGHYVDSGCGETRYFLVNNVPHPAKDKGIEIFSGEVPLLGINGVDHLDQAISRVARTTPKHVYDSWVANENGFEGNSDFAPLLKVDECLPRNAVQYYYIRALSAEVTHTFRKHYSVWNVLVFEDGQEIYRGFSTTGRGNNNWEAPTDILVVKKFDKTDIIGKETLQKQRTDTGVRFINVPDTETNDTFVVLQEVDPTDYTVLQEVFLYKTRGGLPAPEVTITCINKFCPPNTCAVDCGDHICCYGSDGISQFSYLK